MKSKQLKIKLYVNTGFSGAKHVDYEYIDKNEWESMSESEQEDYLNDLAVSYRDNVTECGAYLVEEEDDDE